MYVVPESVFLLSLKPLLYICISLTSRKTSGNIDQDQTAQNLSYVHGFVSCETINQPIELCELGIF